MKKILIVDDERALRKVLVDKLDQENYKIFEAKNGAECLDIVKEEKIDLILLDVMMPVMDGVETVKQIRESKEIENVPMILILTNKGDMETVSEMMSLEAFNYILKSDHSLESIVKAVQDQLG